MEYLNTLRTIKREVERMSSLEQRRKLNDELPPEVRRIYMQNSEVIWYGDDICEYIDIDYYNTSEENVIVMKSIALLAAERRICINGM